VRAKVAEKLSLPADGDIIESFAWVGLFSDDVVGAKINTFVAIVFVLFILILIVVVL